MAVHSDYADHIPLEADHTPEPRRGFTTLMFRGFQFAVLLLALYFLFEVSVSDLFRFLFGF
jgi:hypothetical protein